MRYFLTGQEARPLKLEELEKGLQLVDPDYSIEHEGEDDDTEYGLLLHRENICGTVEVNRSGDILRDDLENYRDDVSRSRSPHRARVLKVIEETRSLFVVQVFSGTPEEKEETLRRLEPVCTWLLHNRSGLLHADREGFYDSEELILKTLRL